jgi:hypothetical protein
MILGVTGDTLPGVSFDTLPVTLATPRGVTGDTLPTVRHGKAIEIRALPSITVMARFYLDKSKPLEGIQVTQ